MTDSLPTLRLLLVGDDDVLDVLAELSRHLDYFEVARLDELPDAPLGTSDHLMISFVQPGRSAQVLAQALAVGAPGFSGLVPAEEEGDSPGARAIVAAADLVSAIHDTRA